MAANSTSMLPTSFVGVNNPPFSAPIQVALFFVGVCLVPAMTAHAPIPLTTEDSFGRIVAMILGPVSSSIDSFNSIIIFAVKIGRGNRCWRRRRNHALYHDAISAGALAIRIPKRFEQAIEESPFEWRRLNGSIPIVDESESGGVSNPDTSNDDTILYSLPPTSRIVTDSLKLFPSSNKLKTVFAILQLAYSAVEGYMQYEQMIHSQGLSSPFIIAVAYLYMSLINLIANLVQGSYTHVTIISSTPTTNTSSTSFSSAHIVEDTPTNDASPPTTMTVIATADQTDAGDETSTSEVEAEESEDLPEPESSSQGPDETNQPQPQSQPRPEELRRELENWLQTRFPQIEFDYYPPLSSIAFFSHYSIALVIILTCIVLLTGFQPGTLPSQTFLLLAVILDPIMHLLLAVGQAWSGWPYRIMVVLRGLGGVGVVKLVVWIANLIGCFFAVKILLEIYEGVI